LSNGISYSFDEILDIDKFKRVSKGVFLKTWQLRMNSKRMN